MVLLTLVRLNLRPFSTLPAIVERRSGDPDTFSRMSRAPPIGRQYFDRHRDDLRRLGCCVIEGRQYPIPARYFDWDSEDLMQCVKDSRALRFAGVVTSETSLRSRAITYESTRKNRKEVI